MKIRTKIKKGQIWKQKGNSMTVEIVGPKDGKWKARVLSDRIGMYKGSHTLNERTLWSKYELQ